MRILLIGASGQLGHALKAVFSAEHQVLTTAHRHLESGCQSLDLSDPDRIRTILGIAKPELILIAGAMCAVDRCETEQELCWRINVLGPQVVAEYARAHAGRVVYYSTDHVFDGMRETYREDDPVSPLNIYAWSKAEGEAVLRNILPQGHLVLRTSWLYGPDVRRKNFALRCVDSIRVGCSVPVPMDQWGSPTFTEDLAQSTKVLLARGHSGTFHATGPEFLDRASLARRVCARFGLDDHGLMLKATSELGQPARRPLRVRLDCGRLHEAGVPEFRNVDSGLTALVAFDGALLTR